MYFIVWVVYPGFDRRGLLLLRIGSSEFAGIVLATPVVIYVVLARQIVVLLGDHVLPRAECGRSKNRLTVTMKSVLTHYIIRWSNIHCKLISRHVI